MQSLLIKLLWLCIIIAGTGSVISILFKNWAPIKYCVVPLAFYCGIFLLYIIVDKIIEPLLKKTINFAGSLMVYIFNNTKQMAIYILILAIILGLIRIVIEVYTRRTKRKQV